MLSLLASTAALLLVVVADLDASPAPVSFQRDILPLFAKECVFCHLKEGPDAGLVLEARFAYVMIVDVPSNESSLNRVSRGNPELSYLLLKMQDRHRALGGTGNKMPPGWLAITPAEINLVREWIAAGALNN